MGRRGLQEVPRGRRQVGMAFLAALVCGGVAAATLPSGPPVFAVPRHARGGQARPPVLLRARRGAPAQCAANAASGCLGGYGRVHAATALSVCRALAEAAAVAAAVALAETDASCFAWIGFAYAACALANAAAGAALVAALPPEGSDARLPVMASFSFSFSRVPTAAAERAEETELELDAYASGASFVADGASMFAQSFLLQGTFFGAMVVASRELSPRASPRTTWCASSGCSRPTSWTVSPRGQRVRRAPRRRGGGETKTLAPREREREREIRREIRRAIRRRNDGR